MQIKKIVLSLTISALIFAPAIECAFAGDAFSGLKNTPGNPAAFDGSTSYSKSAPKFLTNKPALISSIKEDKTSEPKPSIGEQTKKLVKANKGSIIVGGAGAFMGYCLLGGPIGAAAGAVAILVTVFIINL